MTRFLAAGLVAGSLILAPVGAGLLSSASAQTDEPNAPKQITPDRARPESPDPAPRSYLPPERPTPAPRRHEEPPPYAPPPQAREPYPGEPYRPPPPHQAERDDGFSVDEISDTGHRFFGRVSVGLAKVIEYAFQRAGRPNGYILGEEAGGAFIAGLRYGEGTLYTKNAGERKVFWQGPSIGYDFGAEGSKTMILVYNLQRVDDIYHTFGGVDGSAYFIGGVGITFQTYRHVTLAPIRSGIGLRLGANVGYLKYTRQPTWNPF